MTKEERIYESAQNGRITSIYAYTSPIFKYDQEVRATLPPQLLFPPREWISKCTGCTQPQNCYFVAHIIADNRPPHLLTLLHRHHCFSPWAATMAGTERRGEKITVCNQLDRVFRAETKPVIMRSASAKVDNRLTLTCSLTDRSEWLQQWCLVADILIRLIRHHGMASTFATAIWRLKWYSYPRWFPDALTSRTAPKHHSRQPSFTPAQLARFPTPRSPRRSSQRAGSPVQLFRSFSSSNRRSFIPVILVSPPRRLCCQSLQLQFTRLKSLWFNLDLVDSSWSRSSC